MIHLSIDIGFVVVFYRKFPGVNRGITLWYKNHTFNWNYDKD